MLNYFPQLLDLGILAPLLWRLALAINYFWLAAKPKTKPNFLLLRLIFGLGSIALVLGVATQVAAIVLAACLPTQFKYLPKTQFFLILTGTLALLFSGAGWPAIDLPL